MNATCANIHGSYTCSCAYGLDQQRNCLSDEMTASMLKDDSNGNSVQLDFAPLVLAVTGVLLMVAAVIVMIVFVRKFRKSKKAQRRENYAT